ncbi:MAG: hypothetical protein BWY36_00854 [Candidatus Diapherotrites archaeon ADurb.Bin253]|nr:MAG: hypothetical protein BWY36_00854 [Candidatus Diapherotrites archaeon ADurb.Bin253]
MGTPILIIIYVLSGIIGLCVGSFLNVVIYRVPLGMSLAKPSSHCPNCQYKLKWYDNIPVISYIILKGKCRSCKKNISIRYTIVEVVTMLLWLCAVLRFIDDSYIFTIIAMLAIVAFIAVFFIDLEHQIIPDRFNIMILLLGVIAIVSNIFFKDNSLLIDTIPWQQRLAGLVFGGLFFLIFHYGSILILKKEALGFGDVKLVAACGLLLGIYNLFIAILVSSIIASVVLLIVRKKKNDKKDTEYPFAPFLIFGMTFAMFFGSYIVNWYISLF